MPELPEAETVRRQLEPQIVGQKIVGAEARLPRRTRPSIDELVSRTLNARITAARRRGKQLYFPLDNGWNLLVHLGMTGRLHVAEKLEVEGDDKASTPHRHVQAWWQLENGRVLVFTDPRTFGVVGVAQELPFLQTMGPEPLDDDFNETRLFEQLRNRRCVIKAALLDQRLVAGIGSIYADEACFLAKIHPAAPVCEISTLRLKTLISHLRPVLERAIEARGATLKDGGYQDTFGAYGEFIPLAYGRTGEPCTVCGVLMQRGTLGAGKSARSYHFCPRCQKIPAKKTRLSP